MVNLSHAVTAKLNAYAHEHPCLILNATLKRGLWNLTWQDRAGGKTCAQEVKVIQVGAKCPPSSTHTVSWPCCELIWTPHYTQHLTEDICDSLCHFLQVESDSVTTCWHYHQSNKAWKKKILLLFLCTDFLCDRFLYVLASRLVQRVEAEGAWTPALFLLGTQSALFSRLFFFFFWCVESCLCTLNNNI